MEAIDVARQVVREKTCCLFRPNRDGLGYDVKPAFTGNKRGWIYLDLFSASTLVQVYDGINEQNRARLSRLPLVSQVKVAFKTVNLAITKGGQP